MNIFTMSVRNVRKSVSDYGVYFLTIVIGVALFYVFNSVESQSVMMDLSKSQSLALLGLGRIMSYLTVFISAVLGFLILYANSFLIGRRKKELGIYMTLGMKKGRISRILICETSLVGLISLVVGLVIGVAASQGIAIITAKMYGFAIKHETVFVFSAPALWKCAIYFGVAFLIVMLFNTVNISRRSLIDLIYADKSPSTFRAPRFGLSLALWLISLVLLGLAYYLALSAGIEHIFKREGSLPIILGIIGTFLFFYSFSGFFLKLISRLKPVYYRKLNLFTLGQLSSRMNTAHISMSFVCLMLFLSIAFISIGEALAKSIRVGYGAAILPAATSTTYITFYIGIIFILASASTLAIAQLSEASDNRARYSLLSKLGAGDKLLAGSLLRQISMYFALPLLLAIIHAAVAISVMSKLITMIGEINVAATCLISGSLIIALYGGYFLMTFLSARKLAVGKQVC